MKLNCLNRNHLITQKRTTLCKCSWIFIHKRVLLCVWVFVVTEIVIEFHPSIQQSVKSFRKNAFVSMLIGWNPFCPMVNGFQCESEVSWSIPFDFLFLCWRCICVLRMINKKGLPSIWILRLHPKGSHFEHVRN